MTELLEKTTAHDFSKMVNLPQTGAIEQHELPHSVEAPIEAHTAPEHYAYSAIDPSVAYHFNDLSLEDQRRRAAVLYNDTDGKEIVDPAAKPYSDYLKEQIRDTTTFDEALKLYYQHNTDPINAIELLAFIAESYTDTLHTNPDAQDKITELAEKNAIDVEKVVRGETDHATPEAGLLSLVVVADIVAENPKAEADILQRLDNVVKVSHDNSNQLLANGHMAADPLLAEAISEAISDRLQIPMTASITLGKLVNQHVEIKKLDLAEQVLADEIEAKQTALRELRNQRSEVAASLEQEVHTAKRRTGIRGLLSELIRVGR